MADLLQVESRHEQPADAKPVRLMLSPALRTQLVHEANFREEKWRAKNRLETLRGRAYARSGFDGAAFMAKCRRMAKEWLPLLYVFRSFR